MPIPTHFKKNCRGVIEKSGYTGFEFVCDCKNNSFFLYKNALTKDEKAELKPYFDFLSFWCCSDLPKEYKEDENGVTHYYVQRNYPNNLTWEEIERPPCPVFWAVTVIKGKCASCGKEYVLFDSRFHGRDAIYYNNISREEREYSPTMKQIQNRSKTEVKLQIKLQNALSYSEFLQYFDSDSSEENYADSFSHISIYSIGENGKKRAVFKMQTV